MWENNIILWWDLNNNGEKVKLYLKMANRHGLISGATWTWKTVSLQVLAEQFSKQWVPVFAVDVKWDLSWIAASGTMNKHIQKRIDFIWLENFKFQGCPTVFWDLYWKKGHPVRTTISDMWPILLWKLMDLTEVQETILHIAFQIADDNGWLMIDLDDLLAMLVYMEENKDNLRKDYGNISTSSLWVVRRNVMVLKQQWWGQFFAEPALQLEHLMKKDFSWNGVVSILDATTLISNSRLYSIFLLWLLAELFEQLPEVGDADKPKLVFFFDEAHLLFKDAPKVLLDKIEQVVRLIRSKWVGIYFVTQNPLDIPEIIRSQLWNRIQHALRAFTPKDQKAIKVVAETFRQNEQVDIVKSLTDMEVGVALVSCLDEKWKPQKVVKTLMAPPMSRIWPLTDEERKFAIENSPFKWLYDKTIDRISADEILEKMEDEKLKQLEQQKQQIEEEKNVPFWQEFIFGTKKKSWFVETVWKAVVKDLERKIVKKATKSIVRWIFGNLLK